MRVRNCAMITLMWYQYFILLVEVLLGDGVLELLGPLEGLSPLLVLLECQANDDVLWVGEFDFIVAMKLQFAYVGECDYV